jgi:hypothetical protein
MNHKPKHIYTFVFDINIATFSEFKAEYMLTKSNRFSFNKMPSIHHAFNPTRTGEFELHITKDYVVKYTEHGTVNKPIVKHSKFVMYSNDERYHANKAMFYKQVFRYLKKHGRVLDSNLLNLLK